MELLTSDDKHDMSVPILVSKDTLDHPVGYNVIEKIVKNPVSDSPNNREETLVNALRTSLPNAKQKNVKALIVLPTTHQWRRRRQIAIKYTCHEDMSK